MLLGIFSRREFTFNAQQFCAFIRCFNKNPLWRANLFNSFAYFRMGQFVLKISAYEVCSNGQWGNSCGKNIGKVYNRTPTYAKATYVQNANFVFLTVMEISC